MSLLLTLVAASPARASDRRALIIGSNHGLADEEPLGHAVDDARRVAEVMRELGGTDPPEVRLLEEPSVDAVLAALGSLVRPGDRAGQILLYFSGHGDEAALHLAGAALPLARLRQEVAAVAAPLAIIVIDACRTAGVRQKGVRAGPTFTVALPAADAAFRGTVMLLASSAGEAAQESARLGGGVFTHFLLSGLRGAADRDGDRRVTLAEAYEFAHGRTLARSIAQSGTAQRPEIELDLQGSGPLVLTWLDPAHARLLLPAAADSHYYVYGKGSSALAAEAWGRADGETALALPSGRFVVHRQVGEHHGVAEVSLAFGGEARLVGATFAELPREEALARGGRLEVRPSTAAVMAGVTSSGRRDLGATASLRLLHGDGEWVYGARVTAAAIAGQTSYNDVLTERLDGGVIGGWQHATARLTAYLLADVSARLESVRLRGRSTAASSAPPEAPTLVERSLGVGPGARLGIAVPLSARLAFVAEASASFVVFRERAASGEVHLVAPAVLGLESGLSLGF